MKKLLLFITVLVLFSCVNKKGQEANDVKYIGDFSHYTTIDTSTIVEVNRYQVDLDFDLQEDTIVLENLKDLKGEPQLFTMVRIHLATGKKVLVKNIGGYTIDTNTVKKFPNRISSDKIYIPEYKTDNNYLILWDWQYPSCDAEVNVLKISKGDIHQVFKENFYISEINDFDKDGNIDFKGKPTCETNEKDRILTLK